MHNGGMDMPVIHEYTLRVQVDADVPKGKVFEMLTRLADEAYSSDVESFEADHQPKKVVLW